LEPILKVTYGCIVYQEQVMQILQALAGYSLGRADIVRRAMSKKKHDVMARERDIFVHGLTAADGTVEVEGCIRRGIPETVADGIFDEMSSFASYAFNKSHAAAYALVSYQTAYLKCVYPKEYMAALLTSVSDGGKVAEYIRESERLGIHVLPPSVNYSRSAFLPEGDNIRFGLLAVKNIGTSMIKELCREREQNGAFTSFSDFCRRMSTYRECNRRAIESLIQCGALDNLGANRHQMLENVSVLLERFDDQNRRHVAGQLGFFDDPSLAGDDAEELPPLPELPYARRLAMEKEVTGLYLSGHPLSPYEPFLPNMQVTPITELLEQAEEHADKADGASVRIFGLLSDIRTKSTKNGSSMAYAALEDLTSSIELVFFSKTLLQFSSFIHDGAVIIAFGRLSLREDQPPSVIVDRVSGVPSSEELPKTPKKSARYGLYLRLSGKDDPAWNSARALLNRASGDRPVFIRLADSGKLVRVSGLSVKADPSLLRQLEKLLGDTNVALLD
ncbi:MAG: OB-fold nucleic acid binding domain-containing protein, partial [Acutalibacteraceae bacterium]